MKAKTKDVVKDDKKLVETRRVLIGETSLTRVDLTIQEDGYIFLSEKFKDVVSNRDMGVFNVGMIIRNEFVGRILRVLMEAGYKPEDK